MLATGEGAVAGQVTALAHELDAAPHDDPDEIVRVTWPAVELTDERAVVSAPFGLDRGDRFAVRVVPAGAVGKARDAVAQVASQRIVEDRFEITLTLEPPPRS